MIWEILTWGIEPEEDRRSMKERAEKIDKTVSYTLGDILKMLDEIEKNLDEIKDELNTKTIR